MVSVFSPVMQLEPAELRRVTDVTDHGVVYGTVAALERMLPRDRGTIVQVGSALAYPGIPGQAAYCAAKHAVQGFTESLRCELFLCQDLRLFGQPIVGQVSREQHQVRGFRNSREQGLERSLRGFHAVKVRQRCNSNDRSRHNGANVKS